MAFFDKNWYVNFGDGSSTGYYAVAVWPGAGQVVTAGTWCRQSATPATNSERCFVAIVAGTTGGSEPSWTVTRGAKTTDNTVTWQECTGMAGPCGDTANAPAWVASRALTLGEVYYDSSSGSLQIVSTAGTSKSGAQPTFSATAGVTTADNTVTWTSLGLASGYTATPWLYPHARIFNALTSTWVQAGNNVYVPVAHAETQSTALTMPTSSGTSALPISIICVANTSAAPPTTLSTGASISTTGASSIALNTGNIYWYGFSFNAGSGSSAANIVAENTLNITAPTFDTCAFTLNNTSTNSLYTFGLNAAEGINGPVLRNCSFIFGSTSQTVGGGSASDFSFTCIGGSWASSGSVPTTLFAIPSRSCAVTVRDCDVSAVTGTLIGNGTFGQMEDGYFYMENCKLGSGVTLPTSAQFSTYQQSIKLFNCDSGATNYKYGSYAYGATVLSNTSITRSGGASDGTTAISWQIVTNANNNYYQPFQCDEIAQWNALTSGSHTASIYLTTNASLTNATFWIELEYLGNSSYPIGSIVTSKAAILATPVALTTDTSTWSGTAQTNKYVVSVSFSPLMAGPLKCRIFAAGVSQTIYVDPLLVIV